LKLLHVVKVVSGNGVSALYRFLEELDRVDESELLIACHMTLLWIGTEGTKAIKSQNYLSISI